MTKKTTSTMALAVVAAGLLASTTLAAPPEHKTNSSGKGAATDAAARGIDTLAVADDLAQWARSTHNPMALALAGSMMQGIGGKAMSPVPAKTQEADKSKTSTAPAKTPAPTPADGGTLITEAKEMAKGDTAALAAIDQAVASVPKAKGDVTGPNYHQDCVRAYSTDRYDLTMAGSQRATVLVSGDGDTDLDLLVYDQNGNLIASDTDGTDQCLVTFVPAWTGPFTIAIQNFGSVYNCYTLRTN